MQAWWNLRGIRAEDLIPGERQEIPERQAGLAGGGEGKAAAREAEVRGRVLERFGELEDSFQRARGGENADVQHEEQVNWTLEGRDPDPEQPDKESATGEQEERRLDRQQGRRDKEAGAETGGAGCGPSGGHQEVRKANKLGEEDRNRD